jgi:hypothetical protein
MCRDEAVFCQDLSGWRCRLNHLVPAKLPWHTEEDMSTFTTDEAQLFRVLTRVFGAERVVPNMRAVAVCGGSVPEAAEREQPGTRSWATTNTCLFTLIDHNDDPQLVIEFFSGFKDFVDPREEQHQRFLPNLLAAAGVKYLTLTREEFTAIIECGDLRDFYYVLGEKLGLGNIYDTSDEQGALQLENSGQLEDSEQ